jgi:hypothetical protein
MKHLPMFEVVCCFGEIWRDIAPIGVITRRLLKLLYGAEMAFANTGFLAVA